MKTSYLYSYHSCVYATPEVRLEILLVMFGCVVVTGAGSGIGRAISTELNKKGFIVALWDKDKV